MSKFSFKIIVILVFILSFSTLYSQNQSDKATSYNWFDAIVGVENTGLYNGTEYQKQYRTKEGNDEFYKTSDFVEGSIVYDQQHYYNVYMLYDVYKDEIIVRLSTQSSLDIIQLIKEKIESFSINNKLFVRVSNNENQGFHEVLFKSNYLTLYKKHIKQRVQRSDEDFAYYVFKDKKNYIIKYNHNYYTIKSKSDFFKIFPEQKKDINSFYKTNKTLFKSDYDLFLNKLSNHIETLKAIKTSAN